MNTEQPSPTRLMSLNGWDDFLNDDYRLGFNYSPPGDLLSPNSFLSTPPRNEATRQISRPAEQIVQRPITFAVCQLTEQLVDHFRNNQTSSMGTLREQLTGVNKLLQGNPRNFWGWVIAYRIATEFSPVQVLGKNLSTLDCLYRAHYHCDVAEGVSMIKARLEVELNQTIGKRNRLEAKKSERELAKQVSQASQQTSDQAGGKTNGAAADTSADTAADSTKGAKKRPLEST